MKDNWISFSDDNRSWKAFSDIGRLIPTCSSMVARLVFMREYNKEESPMRLLLLENYLLADSST
jgi:hypothetical protein